MKGNKNMVILFLSIFMPFIFKCVGIDPNYTYEDYMK